MIDHSVSLKIAFGQLFNLQHRITQQFTACEALVHLACEMAHDLYQRDPTSPYLARWYELTRPFV